MDLKFEDMLLFENKAYTAKFKNGNLILQPEFIRHIKRQKANIYYHKDAYIILDFIKTESKNSIKFTVNNDEYSTYIRTLFYQFRLEYADRLCPLIPINIDNKNYWAIDLQTTISESDIPVKQKRTYLKKQNLDIPPKIKIINKGVCSISKFNLKDRLYCTCQIENSKCTLTFSNNATINSIKVSRGIVYLKALKGYRLESLVECLHDDENTIIYTFNLNDKIEMPEVVKAKKKIDNIIESPLADTNKILVNTMKNIVEKPKEPTTPKENRDKQIREFISNHIAKYGNKTFTSKEIVDTGIPDKTVSKYLVKFTRQGLLIAEKNGHSNHYTPASLLDW